MHLTVFCLQCDYECNSHSSSSTSHVSCNTQSFVRGSNCKRECGHPVASSLKTKLPHSFDAVSGRVLGLRTKLVLSANSLSVLQQAVQRHQGHATESSRHRQRDQPAVCCEDWHHKQRSQVLPGNRQLGPAGHTRRTSRSQPGAARAPLVANV